LNKLNEVVTELFPERGFQRVFLERSHPSVHLLLRDAIRAVKKKRVEFGLPVDVGAVAMQHQAPTRKRGKCMSDKVRSELMARLTAQSAQAGPSWAAAEPLVSAEFSRSALCSSRHLGTILVRSGDLVVVESSRAVELLCPGARDGMLRGYRNQSLTVAVGWDDSFVVRDLQDAALDGSLGVGHSLECSLLRLGHEEESGCLLATYVRATLRVAHVSPDRGSFLLMFEAPEGMLQPLRTGADFWRRFYAPGEGMASSMCHLFRKVPQGQLAAAYAHTGGTPVSVSIQAHRGRGMGAASLAELSSSLVTKAVEAIATDFDLGVALHVGKDSPSSTLPRFMAVVGRKRAREGGEGPSVGLPCVLPGRDSFKLGAMPTLSMRHDGEPARVALFGEGAGIDMRSALLVGAGASLGAEVPVRFAHLEFVCQRAPGSSPAEHRAVTVHNQAFSDVGWIFRAQGEGNRIHIHALRSGVARDTLGQIFDLYEGAPPFVDLAGILDVLRTPWQSFGDPF